jgi:hypothetical protein
LIIPFKNLDKKCHYVCLTSTRQNRIMIEILQLTNVMYISSVTLNVSSINSCCLVLSFSLCTTLIRLRLIRKNSCVVAKIYSKFF